MGKRRVKQQKISVTGLFKLAGRHKKMDDVFVYHECQSTRWSHSTKNKNKTNSIKNVCHVTCLLLCLFVCSFFHMPFLYVLSTCSFFSYAFTIRFVYLFVFLCAFPNVQSTCSFVCFFKCLSYTFCLVVRFICIKRAVFKHRNRHL